ncbi:hypothetical protein K2P97_04240 [bacterium]|nr:hypothetical protein [bacterium]
MKNFTLLKKRIILTGIFVAIFFGASCLKKQNLEEESFGDAVPPESVAQALSDGFGPIDYNDMKPNEVSSIVLTQSIQEGNSQTIEQQDVTIQSINNTSTYLQLNVLATTISYNGGGQTSQSTRQWSKVFQKYSGFALSAKQNEQATAQADVNEPMYMFQVVQNLALGSCYNEGNYPETCHNLVVTDINYKVPSSSAHQHACADIYNCLIPAKKIEFDLIRKYELESDGKPKRIHYTLILSPHVPFSSRLLRYCTRSLYDIQGVPQKVLADICYNVNSYTFGQ